MTTTDETPKGTSELASDWPVPDAELCDRYEKVPTAAINDVLRAEGLINQVLPPGVAGLQNYMRIAGIAFTIKGSKSLQLDNEMEERAGMLEAIPDQSVCVWDTSNDDESAQWGEVMTMAAMRQGCRGAIVDGGVRDTDKILDLKFPVFCKYRTSNGMLGRFRMTNWQTPIRIGSVIIQPGDIVAGDIDGVIVVPRAMAWKTLIAAEQIQHDEIALKKMITDGVPPREVVERGGYF